MTVGERSAVENPAVTAVSAPIQPRRCFSETITAYYESVLEQLNWPGDGDDPSATVRTLGLTSHGRGEGVTTTAAALAATAASCCEGPVLLIDVSRTSPTLHDLFGIQPESAAAGNGQRRASDHDVAAGATAGLSGSAGPHPSPLPEGEGTAVGPHPSSLPEGEGNSADELPLLIGRASVPTGVHNLHLLSAESIVPARRGRVGLERVAEAAAAATARYELVVLDLPPAGERSAAIHLSGLVDGVLLVVEAEGVSWEAAGRIQQLLGRAGANVLGAILNKRRNYMPAWYHDLEGAD